MLKSWNRFLLALLGFLLLTGGAMRVVRANDIPVYIYVDHEFNPNPVAVGVDTFAYVYIWSDSPDVQDEIADVFDPVNNHPVEWSADLFYAPSSDRSHSAIYNDGSTVNFDVDWQNNPFGATVVGNFITPGYWDVYPYADVDFWTNAGHSPEYTAYVGGVDLQVTAVGIDRVILEGSNPENRGPLFVARGKLVTVRAMPAPVDLTVFPSGWPTWTLSKPTGSSTTTTTAASQTATVTPDIVGDYTIQGVCGSSNADIVLHVIAFDLTAYRPQQPDPANNGAPTYAPFSKCPVATNDQDLTTYGPGIRRYHDPADLVEISLIFPASIPSGCSFVFERSNANLDVCANSNGTGVLTFTSNISASLSSSTLTYYVKWSGGGTGDLAMLYFKCVDNDGHSTNQVRATFHRFHTIFVAIGGLSQDPTDLETNTNFFIMPHDLYRLGYDVRMYNEDTLSDDWRKANESEAYAAITRALTQTGASDYAVFGYSKGGGKSCAIAIAVGRDAVYSAYVDGIIAAGWDPEGNRPPSAYFANYYHSKHFGEILGGQAITGANEQRDVRAAPRPPGDDSITHGDIDDMSYVHTQIEGGILTLVTR